MDDPGEDDLFCNFHAVTCNDLRSPLGCIQIALRRGFSIAESNDAIDKTMFNFQSTSYMAVLVVRENPFHCHFQAVQLPLNSVVRSFWCEKTVELRFAEDSQ